MSAVARVLTVLVTGAVLLAGPGCQSEQFADSFQYLPLFGDTAKDTTPVLAKVAGVEITEMDLDLYLDELPPAQRSRYNGPDGRRLALKKMVEQALMVLGAVDLELYRDQDVSRTLISQRRNALDSAMRNYGLLRGKEPSEQDIQQYFTDNRDKFRQLGLVKARHVETRTREDAQRAYDRLKAGGRGNDFPHIVKEFSQNPETAKNDGELGWFNKGGFVPYIRSGTAFTAHVYDLPDGVSPPFQIADRWHVAEVSGHQPDRPSTFAEARDQVIKEMTPGFQAAIIEDYLLEARTKHGVQMFGEFAPGKGMTPEEIFARAMALPKAQDKIDLFDLITSDFPESDRADDALFMAAQVVLEAESDPRSAARYLTKLIDHYPQSELISDAKYLLENLYNPKVISPKSIEDLRR